MLSADPTKISVADSLKLTIFHDRLVELLQEHEPVGPVEEKVCAIYTSPENDKLHYLSQNHMNNMLFDISFILTNPFNIDSHHFDELFDNFYMIALIPYAMANIWNTVIIHPQLHKFYNKALIETFITTLSYEPVSREYYLSTSKRDDKVARYAQYEILWDIFAGVTDSVVEYLTDVVLPFYNDNNIDGPTGCKVVSDDLYYHCLRLHVGFDFKHNTMTLDDMRAWAVTELDKLVEQTREYVRMVRPDIADLPVNEMMRELANDTTQKFASCDEFVADHNRVLQKYRTYFVDDHGFPNYEDAHIIVFSDVNLPGGYYFNNAFYLNTCDWMNAQRYETEVLVLHETIPGHHTQIHVNDRHVDNDTTLLKFFGSLTNGFVEGWGLYSEKLGSDQTPWDNIGRLQYDMLRTLRIIADIDLHHNGVAPDNVIAHMRNYLAMSDKVISSEVYRYVAYPGQAVSYKVGCHIISQQYDQTDLLSDQNLGQYIDLINRGSVMLDALVDNPADIRPLFT